MPSESIGQVHRTTAPSLSRPERAGRRQPSSRGGKPSAHQRPRQGGIPLAATPVVRTQAHPLPFRPTSEPPVARPYVGGPPGRAPRQARSSGGRSLFSTPARWYRAGGRPGGVSRESAGHPPQLKRSAGRGDRDRAWIAGGPQSASAEVLELATRNRSRRTRCRILPVSVRGMSASGMKLMDRDRL